MLIGLASAAASPDPPRPAPSGQGGLRTIALTGDTIVTRSMKADEAPDFRALLELLRGADAAATNLETLFHDFEGPAMPSLPSLRSEPKLAGELAWAGFDLVGRANNHAADYGAAGLRETTRHVSAAGLVQAGAGDSGADARRAGVLRRPSGTVALVSTTSTFPDFARAGNARGRIPARPGVSALTVRTTTQLPSDDLERLRDLAKRTGADPPAEGAFDFGSRRFTPGEKTAVSEEIDAADLAAISQEVRRAAASADVTLVSIHSHEAGSTRSEPAPFLREFAHAMIEAGADAVFGHGPHVLRGIEIYGGKPILYSLGNFFFEYETVDELPADDYEAVGLPATARPADFFDRYDRGGERGYPAEPEVWESVVAMPTFQGRTLRRLELRPITLGFGLPRGQRGRPALAHGESARRILERLARLSEPFGTRIEISGDSGLVALPAPGPAAP